MVIGRRNGVRGWLMEQPAWFQGCSGGVAKATMERVAYLLIYQEGNIGAPNEWTYFRILG